MNNMNFSLLSNSETLHQLATIGLYYLNFVSNEQSIDSNLVKKYYEISADYLKKEFENVDNLNDHKTSLISNTRHYRPDSLLKYPFVDSSTVNDVLHEKDVKINCLNMNGPALRHLIKQVHDNFKIGSSGFRISDLSNAFEAMGLGKEYEWFYHDLLNSKRNHIYQNYISLNQWTLVAIKTIDKIKAKMKEQKKTHIDKRHKHENVSDQFLESNITNRSVMDRNVVSGEFRNNNIKHKANKNPSIMKRSKSCTSLHDRKLSSTNVNKVSPSDIATYSYYPYDMDPTNQIVDQMVMSDHTNDSMYSESKSDDSIPYDQNNEHVYTNPRQTSTSNSKVANDKYKNNKYNRRVSHPRAVSHTREQIITDRKQFFRSRLQREKSALESIGSMRIQQLSERHNQADYTNINISNELSQKKNIRNRSDSTSGSATLAIAESFLHGSVSRNLMESECDEAYDKISQNQNIMYNFNVQSNADSDFFHIKDISSKKNGPNVSNVSRKNDTNKNEFDGGWKSTKGGWVADFGPPHTHTLGNKKDFMV